MPPSGAVLQAAPKRPLSPEKGVGELARVLGNIAESTADAIPGQLPDKHREVAVLEVPAHATPHPVSRVRHSC